MSRKYPLTGYMPLNYDQINIVNGQINPSMLKYCNAQTYAYWQRSLFQRAISTLKFIGLPESWDGPVRDFFNWCIFAGGHVGVFETQNFGLSFQPGSPYGFDFYYQPTEYIVANPKLNKRFKIHKDCEVIKLCPDWRGIWDIISYYALLLSQLDNAINMSIVNNKFAFLLGAKNKAAAEAMKKAFDKINSGEPAVILDDNLFLKDDQQSKTEPYTFLERSNLKQSYLTTDQLMDRQTLLSAFDAEIGINSLPYNKKERLVTAEAESREGDSTARLKVWKETLDSSLKLVNDMFGTNISVSIAYDEGKEDSINENDFNRDGELS